MFAQVHLFEWIDASANTASVLGLLLSRVAFPATWRIQRRINVATREAVGRVALLILARALEEIHRHLAAALEAAREGLWPKTTDRRREAQWHILRLVGNPRLTPQEALQLRARADDLSLVIRYVETNKRGPNPPRAFQQDKKAILEEIGRLVTDVQGRIEALTWEA